MKRWEKIALAIVGLFLVLQLCIVLAVVLRGPRG